MSYEDYLFNILHANLARRLTTHVCDVSRTDYTAQDNTGITVYDDVSMSIDIGAGGLLNPPVPGLAGYSVFAKDKDALQPGDILTPEPDGQSPVLTIVQNFRKQEPVAIRTNRMGTLTNSTSNVIYSNVLFDWYKPAGADSPLIPGLQTSPDEEQRHAALFVRQAVRSGYRLIDELGDRWRIMSVNFYGNVVTYSVIRDVLG